MRCGRPPSDTTTRTAHRCHWPGSPGGGATGFTGEPRQVWLAADDTGPVGCYLLELPHRENTGLGDTVVVVAPGARRRGLGTELLAHCCAQAGQDGPHPGGRRDAGGRTRAMPSLARQAAAAGLTEVRRILPVDDALPARLTRLRAEAEPAAAGYELLTWAGRDPLRVPRPGGAGERGHERRPARGRHRARALGRRPGPAGRGAAAEVRRAAVLGGGPPRRHGRVRRAQPAADRPAGAGLGLPDDDGGDRAAPGPPAGPAGQGGYPPVAGRTPRQACAGW